MTFDNLAQILGIVTTCLFAFGFFTSVIFYFWKEKNRRQIIRQIEEKEQQFLQFQTPPKDVHPRTKVPDEYQKTYWGDPPAKPKKRKKKPEIKDIGIIEFIKLDDKEL